MRANQQVVLALMAVSLAGLALFFVSDLGMAVVGVALTLVLAVLVIMDGPNGDPGEHKGQRETE